MNIKEAIIEALKDYEGSDFIVTDELIEFIENVKTKKVKHLSQVEQMQADCDKVIRLIASDYEGAADWNVTETGAVEILDKNDNVLAIINDEQLTNYWNNI